MYLITVLAMILAVFFAQIHPSYLTQQWQRLRSIIFCSVSGYGVIPTLHWVWLNGGIGAPIVQVGRVWSVCSRSFCPFHFIPLCKVVYSGQVGGSLSFEDTFIMA